jgi:hypothetical protein
LPNRLTKIQYAPNVDTAGRDGENPYRAALAEYIIMPCLTGAGLAGRLSAGWALNSTYKKKTTSRPRSSISI